MVDRCRFVEINSFAGVSGEEGTELEFLDAVGKVKLRLLADVGRTKEFIADVTGTDVRLPAGVGGAEIKLMAGVTGAEGELLGGVGGTEVQFLAAVGTDVVFLSSVGGAVDGFLGGADDKVIAGVDGTHAIGLSGIETEFSNGAIRTEVKGDCCNNPGGCRSGFKRNACSSLALSIPWYLIPNMTKAA